VRPDAAVARGVREGVENPVDQLTAAALWGVLEGVANLRDSAGGTRLTVSTAPGATWM
jgi:hypothetical protein